MINYIESQELYNKARDKERGKPLANHTRLVKTSQGYGVKLHDTIVVQILPNDLYMLASGGWRTKTTKERINTYSPANMIQTKNQWYIGGHLYFDGIVINGAGVVQNPKKDSDKEVKIDLKLMNSIKRYTDEIKDIVNSGALDLPSGGDCWHCCMVTQDKKVLGDITGSDHLLSHLRDHYHVPSLVLNALIEAGYAYPWMIVNMKSGDNVKRAVQKYLKRRLLHKVTSTYGGYLVMKGNK